MKKSIKIFSAAVLASMCLTVMASSYSDMGDTVSYTVSSNSPSWENKSTALAWNLQADSLCTYSATVTPGCEANYYLYQWTTTQSLTARFLNRRASFSQYVKATALPSDDYYAKVIRVSGGTNNGTVTFSKR